VTERSLVLIKPDGVARGLIGEVVSRLERRGFTLAALDLRRLDRDTLARHYAEHQGKPFYEPLVEFMMSGPVVVLVAEGQRVIETFRTMAGATDPVQAAPGTIRADLGRDWGLRVQQNLVHGSDSAESAEREIALFFPALAAASTH
jgi:nucleoside-diphosphate kinase